MNDVISFPEQWLREPLCLSLTPVTPQVDLEVCLTGGMRFCPMSVTMNYSCSSIFVKDLTVFSVNERGTSEGGSNFLAFIAGHFPP